MPDQDAPSLLPSRLNRLALRAAFPAAAAVLIVAAFSLLLPLPLWAIVLIASLCAGGAAYMSVHALVAGRLELAHATLRQARKNRLEALGRLQADRRRDELDDVLWQVYRAAQTLQQERERLDQLEDYRREFLANVSHELKTPLFVISGFAEQLLDGALEDPAVNRRFVEKIGRNADRLGHLARDLMAISKMESGEIALNVAPFNFHHLLTDVFDALDPVAERQGVTLIAALPPTLPHVLGDRELLRQAVSNLVDNGVKYNRSGGRVEVSARLVEDSVRIVVTDDGLGIPAEALPRITERFYRVDRSRSRAQGGTGLGLAIVKHVLEAHGQRLRVESRPGYGSSFTFSLPQAEGGVSRETSVSA